jgi:hypothetical protein
LTVEVQPPHGRDGGEAEDGRAGGLDAPVRARRLERDHDDGLAEHDQREERPSLREMAAVRGDETVEAGREWRQA